MKIDTLIKSALEEDIAKGDITSLATVPKNKKVKVKIVANETGILCGVEVAKKVFKEYDKKILFKIKKKDGEIITNETIIAEIFGNAQSLLACERTALNFLQHLSGIATATRKFANRVKPLKIKIMDTRKTIPGLREIEKYAVKCGQGTNHRKGLYDAILIKDNHIKIAGSITKAVNKIKKKYPKKKIEVECKTIEDVKEAIKLKPNIIMLDNMALDEMDVCVGLIQKANKRLRKNKIKTEASGNVTLENVDGIARCNVDFISVGSALTLSAKALDIKMDILA